MVISLLINLLCGFAKEELTRLKSNILIGTLIGLTIGFIVEGFWLDKFDWKSWVIILLAGTLGHFTMAYITQKKPEQ